MTLQRCRLGATLGLALTTLASARPSFAAEEAFPQEESPVSVTTADPQVGRREAPLTLVVFGGYQCVYTMRFLARDLPVLEARYGKDLRVVLADSLMAYHAQAHLAAEAGHGVFELGGEKGWRSFVSEVAQFRGTLDAKALAGLAVLSGIKDRQAFERDLTAGRWKRVVDEGIALRKAVPVSGTPSFFLNGSELERDDKLESSFHAMDGELAEAKALAAKLSARDVYGYRSRQGFGKKLAKIRVFADAPDPKASPLRQPSLDVSGAVGPFRLGMTRTEVEALGGTQQKVDDYWECVAVEDPRRGRCGYELHFEGDRLARIYHPFGPATEGVVFKGKKIPMYATREELRLALCCGPWEYAEGGAVAKCGPKLFLSYGSGQMKYHLLKGGDGGANPRFDAEIRVYAE